MKYSLCLLGLALLLRAIPATAIEQCLQSASRTEACPNLRYKAQTIEGVNGNLSKKMICICLTDFQPLFADPQDQQQQIHQRMAITQLELDTGMTKQQLIDLITN